ncbi:hypothetical protein CDD81_7658 [Ophiocordyceps australis]|uniref:Uncharacterized protein n=1 Tax=Ophiocordyceps australis TaxID=1399860 RepID=A0A2C5Y501_9HYPO|nr:hypothetical protein CDD81_7658 [Ophiocordyceps australis]
MISDEHYELCLPILQDPNLEDEDKTDRLEIALKDETGLTGSSLENIILDALWRYREVGGGSTSPPPIRPSILRRPSPASWRGSPTPLPGSPRLGVSPLAPAGYISSTLNRAKSSTASPFSSPRASPRLALATPVIPHSPNLNAYEFASDPTPPTEILGDYQMENVEWLVNDDAASVSSSVGASSSALNAAAPEFSSLSSQQTDMSPYDMLRSILGQTRTDHEIEAALSLHGYDLSATITSIMESQPIDGVNMATANEEPKGVLIGKSIMADARPATPLGQQKSGVVCKFYMSTGQCLRADCRFSHDLSNYLCKYWVMGNCLAGDTCIFSHDPTNLMGKLGLDEAEAGTSKNDGLDDGNWFPALQPETSGTKGSSAGGACSSVSLGAPPPGPRHMQGTESPRLRSRPGSRQQVKNNPMSAPAMDDNEAFPSLGAALSKQGKKHHGKRGGHGHGHKENLVPSSLADIVKRTPSPAPGPSLQWEPRRAGMNGSAAAPRSGENSAAALAIPGPKHIPWLETGEWANKSYLKARQDAIKHGGLRNKFLQSAAQAWNRNDARAAKALSLRGQSENDLMRKAHRDAARELYQKRNKTGVNSGSEIFVDLHGLHAEEAVEYLEKVLLENSREARPIYAITGTGHHSKNGKDKVGRTVRGFLNEWRYAYREFSVPGDRNNMGGILGIDARSWDKSLGRFEEEEPDILSQGVEIGDGKVRLLVRDAAKGPGSRR